MSEEKLAVSTAHERPSAADGAADMVAQVVARIAPVGLDARLAEERDGDVTIGRAVEPSVERLQHHAEPPPVRLDHPMVWKSAAPHNVGEAFERNETGSEMRGRKNGIGQQAHRLGQACAADVELKRAAGFRKEKVLSPIRHPEERRPAWGFRQAEAAGIAPCTGGKRAGWQNVRTRARIPEDNGLGRCPLGRIGEKTGTSRPARAAPSAPS